MTSLSEREEGVVRAWLDSGKQFHVMRDGPFHLHPILAGLWGAVNYLNITRATHLREGFKNSSSID